MEQNEVKPVRVVESPTMWTFAAIAVASAITELLASPDFKLALGSYATVITFGLGLIGMWLRKYTTRPLEPVIKPKPKLNPLEDAIRKEAEENGLV